ncbi:MAG: hypothetical protein MZV70_58215 [Desulfobacterales bacterium]|nr:hypothetical protein [Desulfobacterales bacterium]
MRTWPHLFKGSLCGLGKTAPSPVLSTLKQFPRGI